MKLIKPVAVTDSGSFTRASTATYCGSDGLIKTAAVNAPRLNYNPENLSSGPVLQLESAATNLITYSDQLDNAAWAKTRSSIIANAATAPDGTSTADKLVEDSTASNTHKLDINTITISNGTYYTLSVYVKAGERTSVELLIEDAGVSGATFNLSNATITAPTSSAVTNVSSTAKIEQLANGWCRCSIIRLSAATTGYYSIRLVNTTTTYTGGGTSGLFIWGAQLESGSVATSYIPTATVAVTRSADINTATLVSTVPENDYTAWSEATAYTVGAYCILVSTHKIYQCLVNNTNFSPDVNLTGATPKWLEISATNKWKMFDASWGSQTSIATPLTIALTPGAIINSLALLNVAATSITVSMTVSAVEVYTATASMIGGEAITDWYDYFFTGISYKTDLVLTGLPPYSAGVITITINDTGGTAKCGNCVMGSAVEIGSTQYGATAGITDYSTKTVDTFGNATVVRRTYSKRMTAKLQVYNTALDSMITMLAGYRSTPIVWIGADNIYTSLIVYGFYKSFDVDISYPTVSVCSLDIEGLT